MVAQQTVSPLPVAGSVLTPRRLAIFAAIGPVLFWVVALGVVTPLEWGFLHSIGWRETGPSPIPYPSSTSLGTFGWLQILNFCQFGLSLIALAIGLSQSVVPRPRVGVVFVFLAGVAGLASMFKTDLTYARPVTWHGWIHALAFVLLIIAFIAGVVAFAAEMRKDRRWRWVGFAGPGLLVLALVVGAASNRLLPPLPYYIPGPLQIVFAWYELLALRLLLLPPGAADRPPAEP
jgi:uncharacterized protein DUF998